MDKPMVWQALRNRIALNFTSVACRLSAVPRHPVTVMGLEFPTPLGIAAGFDRHGALGRRVASLGFGFNEIGSLTAASLARLQPIPPGDARLGVNLTLDARCSTAETCALLRGAWRHADYLVLNLIGPSSAPLLHQGARLHNLLTALREEQHQLNQRGERWVPLIAKLRCLPEQIPFSLAGLLLELGFDGLLAAHALGHRRRASAIWPGKTHNDRRKPANRSSTCVGSAEMTWLCFRLAASRPQASCRHACVQARNWCRFTRHCYAKGLGWGANCSADTQHLQTKTPRTSRGVLSV